MKGRLVCWNQCAQTRRNLGGQRLRRHRRRQALTHHVLGVVSIHIGGHYRDCGDQGEGRGRPGWAAAGGGARWRCSPPCTAGLRQLTLRVSHRSTGRDVPDAKRPSSRASPCPRILFACMSFALSLDATEG